MAAACAAGIGEDGVLVDADLNPLTRALAWFDPRRADLFYILRPRLDGGDDVGTVTDAARTLLGWGWARAQPHAERATAWVALTDYVASRWTATTFLSDTLASRTAAWRPVSRTWHSQRVQTTLGTIGLLPTVLPTGSTVGELRSERLHHAGVLAPGALVVAGGHDHPVGGWGVHQMHPGAILDSMGTAEVVVTQTPAPPSDGSAVRRHIVRDPQHLGCHRAARGGTRSQIQWASQDPAVPHALSQLISGDTAPDNHLFSVGSGTGAVASAPFPAPAASNRACSSPAHGFPTSFTDWHAPSPCAR
ncbi:FGGY family carbohydrate kinase, partial [Streptomyces sp. 5-6(2022)]|uniref:FGGY family carbohydrate kinase n=1 Tax=Streptomyces sp. 5-6(2022) TaxID=2936510 RepID=UPI0023B9B1AA